MQFETSSSPYLLARHSVATTMGRVLLALAPGVIALVAVYGWGVVVQIVWASLLALLLEGGMLLLRRRSLRPALWDNSALVTAWLLAVSLPPLSPWWMMVIAMVSAIVVAKQLYGGLGHNPFNPAMVAYVVLLISFPREMSSWLAPVGLDINAQAPDLLTAAEWIFWPAAAPDALTGATALDQVRTHLASGANLESLPNPTPGLLFNTPGGRGWEWVSLAFALGGLWLVYERVAAWQIPCAMLLGIALPAALFHWYDSAHYASPLFHLVSGAALLGAFFIATDPVSASATPRGRLYYGAGIGLLTYIIRTFGGYPDGVAFAVLLMNIAAPTIDHYTRPRLFGARP